MIRFLVLLLALAFSPQAFAQEETVVISPRVEAAPEPPPVVLELFTSQGCAFCPPADELMGQMIQQRGIIGLSCHVDYFGVKKNALGKSFCTRRQSDYNRIIGGGPRYTPQLIVNGHMDMIGYEAGKVSAGILKARAENILPIKLTHAGNGAYSFSLPQTTLKDGPVQMWMAVFEKPKSISITEGNNFGKTVQYYNVVNRIYDLEAWNGTPTSRSLNAGYQTDDAGIAVIAQNAQTGRIIAAGAIYR